MRVSRSNSAAAAASLLVWLVPLVSSISVPSGKLTPITPAKPTPRYVNPHAPAQPAAVVEYSQDHPEPPPLDPSYVPVRYDYFDTLAKHHVYYVPLRFPNFNGVSNHIDYEPRQKFYGQTLGKNIGYKPFKQQLYFPARQSDWNQQNNYVNNQDNQVKDQYNQNNGQYNQYNNQANNQVSNNNQYSRSTNEYNNQNNNQYNVQPTQQQQHEVFSTQAAPASSVLPQTLSSTPQALSSTPQAQTQNPTQTYSKVDYSSGKGSYDVTGKGGSRSEYYGLTKEDWSKKSVYPKKVVGQGLTPRKFGSHKY